MIFLRKQRAQAVQSWERRDASARAMLRIMCNFHRGRAACDGASCGRQQPGKQVTGLSHRRFAGAYNMRAIHTHVAHCRLHPGGGGSVSAAADSGGCGAAKIGATQCEAWHWWNVLIYWG